MNLAGRLRCQTSPEPHLIWLKDTETAYQSSKLAKRQCEPPQSQINNESPTTVFTAPNLAERCQTSPEPHLIWLNNTETAYDSSKLAERQ